MNSIFRSVARVSRLSRSAAAFLSVALLMAAFSMVPATVRAQAPGRSAPPSVFAKPSAPPVAVSTGTAASAPAAGGDAGVDATEPPSAPDETGGADGAAPAQGAEAVDAEAVDAEAVAKAKAEAEKKAAEEAEKAKKAERLQKIGRLVFDRRPSTVLALWADPEREDDPKKAAPTGAKSAAVPPTVEVAEDAAARLRTIGYSISGGTVTISSAPVVVRSVTGVPLVSAGAPVKPPAVAGAVEGAEAVEATAVPAEPAGPDPFDASLERLKDTVTLGLWEETTSILADMDDELGEAAYKRMLVSLKTPPKPKPQAGRPINMQFAEKNLFSLDDVMALVLAAPADLEEASLKNLGSILKVAIGAGHAVEGFVYLAGQEVDGLPRVVEKPEEPVDDAGSAEDGAGGSEVAKAGVEPTAASEPASGERETGSPEGEEPDAGEPALPEHRFEPRDAAKILFAAGHLIEAGDFLPGRAEAESAEDHEALNMLARVLLARYREDSEPELLEDAWKTLQAIFAGGEVDGVQKAMALTEAVDLVPKIRDELGEAWLAQSFTEEPDRGMDIIAAIGSTAAKGLMEQPRNPTVRSRSLGLQKTAVDALLEAAPERAEEWSVALQVLALNWLREAEHSYVHDTSTSRGPALQRDAFGNYFYNNFRNRRSNQQVQPILTGEVLEALPGPLWQRLLPESLIPEVSRLVAQLLLKVGEEDGAFPYIEALSATHPQKAEELANEFIRVWTDNHDPNAARNRTNYYMFMYGFDQRAASIPLTRSKQERNLEELSDWVRRLSALPIEVDVDLITRAFTACHSSAEVYKIEDIAKVFGSLEDLDPETIAQLAQRMRTNLVSIWRDPAGQENAKTKRKKKDIEAEVLRGYAVARGVVESAQMKYPEDWRLQLAKAALAHDELVYRHDLAKSSGFAAARQQAFGEFALAADLYAETVPDLAEDDYSTRVHELWFYAALGACDLQEVDPARQAVDSKQPPRIRESLESLGGIATEKHLERFANTLFTRMSSVNPGAKFRYLESGFEIVGDHPHAREARKVYDYYNDLVTEIRLEASVDGSDTVGHEKPFGVFVNLRHTREIERESGGFGRYLQNQNTGTSFFYNYGRPTEDYRDKFEEGVRTALAEHFEVLSVTFEDPKVHSRATSEYGWRITPYAYLLLQARGPEVDTVPSVSLDLDFLDTSGYVVLPVDTAPLPIDAGEDPGSPRPFADVEITQILDEREADEGKLKLEVKATAAGLVPDLAELVDVDPADFVIDENDDQGVSVVEFDDDASDPRVRSERIWMVSMRAREDLEEIPTTFSFFEPRSEEAATVFQRYVDADLAVAEATISLEERYGSTPSKLPMLLGTVLALVVIGGVLFFLMRQTDPRPKAESGLSIPDKLTPFTAIGFLREIERANGFDSVRRQQLRGSIDQLERRFFRESGEDPADLRAIVEEWARHSERSPSRN